MFFQLSPTSKDYDKFSYIICKHPDSIFERNLGNGRKIIGKFTDDKLSYEGSVQNDNIQFLRMMKELNKSSYIHPQLSCVCPINLIGFDKCFQSVIRGANIDSSEKDFFQQSIFQMILGPFPFSCEKIDERFISIIEMFNNVNIDVQFCKTPFECISKMLILTNSKLMSLTEFLQKVYLISMCETMFYSLTKVEDNQIEKYVNLCKGWLDESINRDRIIYRLCGKKQGLVKLFENELIDNNINENEKLELKIKIEDKINGKDRIHYKKHIMVLERLKGCKSYIDVGCGSGSLIKMVINKYIKQNKQKIKIIGINSDNNQCERARQKCRKNAIILTSNILESNINEESLLPDFLSCIEVIEHMDKEQRLLLINNIIDYIQPKEFILTTPNIDYNVNYDGLKNGQFRNEDHKIEYTLQQFYDEVINRIYNKYNIEFLNLYDLIEGKTYSDTQPSFCIYCKHKQPNERKVDYKKFKKFNLIFDPIYLEVVDYEIKEKEISYGLCSKQLLINEKNIFYLAPTISPVEYINDNNFPDSSKYLEHPLAAFKYYKDRDIKLLCCEKKYMGSRGYILLFKNNYMANSLGFDSPIIINSRAGYPFFDNNDPILFDIYNDIIDNMKTDFIMFDAEIMPWCLKAKGLIEKEFQIPGECAYLSRYYGQYSNIGNALNYLSSLNNYINNSNIEVRIFNILASGNILEYPKKPIFTDVMFGHCIDKQIINENIKEVTKGCQIFKPVEYDICCTSSTNDIIKNVKDWEEFCDNGGEGYVYKPCQQISYTKSGYLIQPAIKVRGKEYLRLIYGIDYLDKDCFNLLTNRRITNKRALAIKEFELSLKILRSFLSQNSIQLKRNIAGFLGMENSFSGNIDRTL